MTSASNISAGSWTNTWMGAAVEFSGFDSSRKYTAICEHSFVETGGGEISVVATGSTTFQDTIYTLPSLTGVINIVQNITPSALGTISLRRRYRGEAYTIRVGTTNVLFIMTA